MNPVYDTHDRLGPEHSSKGFNSPYLFVNWNLGNSCTYKCSYCAKACHDGSFPWPTTEEAIHSVHTLDRVYKSSVYSKKTIFFELLGGEVTLWPGLDALTEAIRDTGNQVMLVSNGVRSIDWWGKNKRSFYHVTLSYHPEFADYKHVAEVANLLRDAGVSTSILLLMYTEKWSQCLEAHEYFSSNCRATLNLQRLTLLPDSEFAKSRRESSVINEVWPYSQEQIVWMQQNEVRVPTRSLLSKLKPLKGGALRIMHFSSTKKLKPIPTSSSHLNTHGLNNWKGWDCYVGIDTLYLEQNGDIKRSVMCGVAAPLGSWRKVESLNKVETWDSVQWPTKPVVCPYSKCFCSHDYKARKQKPIEGP